MLLLPHLHLLRPGYFIPRRHGGKNHQANRVLACQPCNNAKGGFDPVQFGIWHPDDPSPEGKRALLLLRRLIIKRQLSVLRRRKIPQLVSAHSAQAEPDHTRFLLHSRIRRRGG
jgi:hypothetical protein